DPTGSPLRRAGRRVLHQGVLHRPGNRLAPPLPRPHQPLPARPPVRRRAARRPGGRVEQRDAPRSRRRPRDEPRLGARKRRAAWRAAALGVRGIVHAAAVVQRRCSWERYFAVNVEGTRLATLAAGTAGARLVHISSVAVYGGSGAYGVDPERRAEDSPFLPIVESDFYARSKRMAEALVREAAGGGLSTVALRPNVVYGERDRLFTPRLIRVARLGVVP